MLISRFGTGPSILTLARPSILNPLAKPSILNPLARPSILHPPTKQPIRPFSSLKLGSGYLTIPNLLSSSRLLILSPLLYHSIQHYSPTTSLALLSLAAATDALDGLIARSFPSQRSEIGSVLDPLADKVLMTCCVVGCFQQGLISPIIGGLILARDLLLVAGVAVVRWRDISDKSRFFDAGYQRVVVEPPFISKLNTALQVLLVWTCVGGFQFELLGVAVGCTTVWSGVLYAISYRRFLRIRK